MLPAPDLTLSTISARLIDSIRINTTLEVQHDSKAFLLKRRRHGLNWIIHCGNLFLRMSNSHIQMFPAAQHWQAWEVHSFTLLHRADCRAVDTDAVLIEKLPGLPLKRYLESGLLTDMLIHAAAREFRRAHTLHSERSGGLWSHGDPHLENVLYDADSDRAFLIDFETRHCAALDTDDRHADDLLVFLLDLVGRAPTADWQRFSRHFLVAYDRTEPINRLYARLSMPAGLELILWKTRTANLPTGKLRARLAELRAIVADVGSAISTSHRGSRR